MAGFVRDLWQRLGRLDPDVARLAGRSPIWLHAASVGEVLSAAPLVECLRRDESAHPIFATTTSLTGRGAARERLGLPSTLLPLDLPPIVATVLHRLQPVVLVILETEIWPSLIRSAARQNVPVLMVSARLSPRAVGTYDRFRPIFRSALALVTAVATQTADDSARFERLGVPRDRMRVLGSLKFSRSPDELNDLSCPIDFGSRPVVVAASTQPEEEEVVIDACRVLWQAYPDLLLVLAPRRPERFSDVAHLIEARGLKYVRRSAAQAVASDVLIFLLDTLGELSRYFSGARAAFVGGTLAPLGGHNVLEPVVHGVPVAFGPRTENVRDAAELLISSGAGVVVNDALELARAWRESLANPADSRARGERGRDELRRGARVAEEIAALVRRHMRRAG